MDKNTITGLVLIGILLVGFSFLSRPSEEQIAAQKKYYDSIALVQQQEEAHEGEQSRIGQQQERSCNNSRFFRLVLQRHARN